MMNLAPFLLFDGTCAAALRFYQSCLGGRCTLTRLGDTPMRDQMPPELHGRVAYAHFQSGAIEFSAADWLHPTRRPQRGNLVALYVTGETDGELQEVFDRLSAGADPELRDDLGEMPFGLYGHLADQFGVHWFFRGGKD
jgi:PhnB protein